MHLRYDMYSAYDAGENRHPQAVMRELGVTYQHATPQSIADQWWFWNCTGVPDPLPEYLSELKLDPHKQIGYGLTQEDADRIASHNTPDAL